MANIIAKNNTHHAIQNSRNNTIDIFITGFSCGDLHFEDEYLYSIPGQNQDDLFAIFENFDESNRINMAEATEEFLN